MTDVEALFQPGERITHHEYGQGVVLDPARDGSLGAFFGVGERRVLVTSLRRELTRTELWRFYRFLLAPREGLEPPTR
ncbi:hypothetical protein [Acidiferrobacter sp.]|uniref:hypothetical protein n=1 Tax=Acidiferrobacter sp. TaxID=1872107 RepID=UPI0026278112|nr:hypothetical protein [Acidiferrobacter sp.]